MFICTRISINSLVGVLCFAPTGKIIWLRHNLPGSWSDGNVCSDFLLKLCSTATLPGYGVLADTAFAVRETEGRVSTPLKAKDWQAISSDLHDTAKRLSNAITALRQAAEWGMGAVEKPYKRLKVPLPFDPIRRRLLLENIHRLYNLRVERTGISQIRSVFVPQNKPAGALLTEQLAPLISDDGELGRHLFFLPGLMSLSQSQNMTSLLKKKTTNMKNTNKTTMSIFLSILHVFRFHLLLPILHRLFNVLRRTTNKKNAALRLTGLWMSVQPISFGATRSLIYLGGI